MKSLVLVINHQTCACGSKFTSPNGSLLTRETLTNFARSASYLKSINRSYLIPFNTRREVLNIYTSIDHCQYCFEEYGNTNQRELFPSAKALEYIFNFEKKKIEIKQEEIAVEVKAKAKKLPAKNQFNLSFFAQL